MPRNHKVSLFGPPLSVWPLSGIKEPSSSPEYDSDSEVMLGPYSGLLLGPSASRRTTWLADVSYWFLMIIKYVITWFYMLPNVISDGYSGK